MAKELNGPYALEITELSTELEGWNRQLQEARNGIQLAAESGDLATLIELRAVRDAIPDIVAIMAKKLDELRRLRQLEINRQSVEAHEARFEDLPKNETITNPNDPNSKTLIVRAKV